MTTPPTPTLAARGIDKRYRGRVALRRAGLTVRPGEAVAIVGENGAGKSTLLRICVGVLVGITHKDAWTGQWVGAGGCGARPAVAQVVAFARVFHDVSCYGPDGPYGGGCGGFGVVNGHHPSPVDHR